MILGIGTDLLDVSRMAGELAKEGGGIRDAVFTPAEIAYCESQRYPPGTSQRGLRRRRRSSRRWRAEGPPAFWRDVEVARAGDAPPRLVLHGRMKEAADRRGVRSVLVSLSHTAGVAAASVVLEG